MDQVHGDPVRAQLVRERLGQVHDRGVAQAADVAGAAAGEPADVDDAPPAPLLHVGRHRLGASHIADHLGVDVLEQGLVIGFRERPAHHAARRRGVVHEHVDVAERLQGGVHQVGHGLRAHRVGDDWNDAASGLVRERLGRLVQGLALPGADRHVHAFRRQYPGDRPADAPAPPRDDRDPACQSQIHVESPRGRLRVMPR